MARTATLFNTTIAALILEELAEGLSLRRICDGTPAEGDTPAQPGVGVSIGTVLRWATGQDAEATAAGFPEQYARARATGFAVIGEQILEIADGRDEADQKRVMIDARKWMLSKMLPKVYGDKLELRHEGEIGVRRIERVIVRQPGVLEAPAEPLPPLLPPQG